MRFTLFYWCTNNGDGSVGVNFAESAQAAQAGEQNDLEEGADGWGESSVSSVELKLEDGKLFVVDHEWNGVNYYPVYKELKP